MDGETLNVVDATQGEVVEPQTNEAVVDVGENNTEQVNSETADQKPVQSAEDNARFAQVRRDAETKARDATIAEMYGESHGITTYAAYQEALAEQQRIEANERFQQEHGIDPDNIKPYFEQWKQSDPDFQELNSIRAEKNITKALNDLNNELKENGVDLQLTDLSDSEVAKLPNIDKVTDYVSKGHTLADAVFLANKKDFIAKQAQQAQVDAVKKISANGVSSPGSLTDSASTGDEPLSDDSISKMSPQQRITNWPAIKKFYGMK